MVVHRWPALPAAANTMPRTARSRSADGVTTAALFPPSSRMLRPSRAATRGRTAAPICSEPVALISGTSGLSTSGWAPAASVSTSTLRFSGAPVSRAARAASALAATAVSVVFSDGFQTTVSPQTRARAAFQDHTAAGKLNAEITPTTPSGCHVSMSRCPGRSDGMVRPSSCRDSPAAKSQMSIISWTSPRASERILPTSMLMRSARSALCSASRSPRRLTRPPRTGAGIARQVRNAVCAAWIAASVSAGVLAGTSKRASPATGLRAVMRSVLAGRRGLRRTAGGRCGRARRVPRWSEWRGCRWRRWSSSAFLTIRAGHDPQGQMMLSSVRSNAFVKRLPSKADTSTTGF